MTLLFDGHPALVHTAGPPCSRCNGQFGYIQLVAGALGAHLCRSCMDAAQDLLYRFLRKDFKYIEKLEYSHWIDRYYFNRMKEDGPHFLAHIKREAISMFGNHIYERQMFHVEQQDDPDKIIMKFSMVVGVP